MATLLNVTGTTPPLKVNGYGVSRVGVEQSEGPAVVREIRYDRPDFEKGPWWAPRWRHPIHARFGRRV
ncbi:MULTISPECIES: hypothetical protein [Cryobacterium]|uniref:Uncharacterized protein n=1 Tax=Cryobacterium breve TaxID=1259258 RepID=A0ABY2J179_9MICO|nr:MULTISPECIES: hypothetical protein [Cryobacterium]TFC96915.1 hypothetical protein E3T20_02680 [Cryobacterium sp. TmT3-12]TFC97289.1 hypothetical protein E3O65_10825 [Cryobacterium breve]